MHCRQSLTSATEHVGKAATTATATAQQQQLSIILVVVTTHSANSKIMRGQQQQQQHASSNSSSSNIAAQQQHGHWQLLLIKCRPAVACKWKKAKKETRSFSLCCRCVADVAAVLLLLPMCRPLAIACCLPLGP